MRGERGECEEREGSVRREREKCEVGERGECEGRER